jgi:phytoene desaturase
MGLFVWYFGTRGTKGMWSDVGHHTILNGPRYRGLLKDIFMRRHLANDMSVYLHRPSVTDPTVAPDGDDTFYALSPVPNLHGDNPVVWADTAEEYRRNLANVLEQNLIPGFEAHLSASEIFTPDTFVSRYLSPHGAGFSLEPRIFQSAWFRPHNISEEVANLYLVGAGTHPGAGIPSVVTSSEVLTQLVPDAPRPFAYGHEARGGMIDRADLEFCRAAIADWILFLPRCVEDSSRTGPRPCAGALCLLPRGR